MSWVAVGMAAAGLLKSELIDKPAAERQRKLAGATQRYSPWTGLQAGKVQEADPFGSAMKYGTTGAMMSNAMGGYGDKTGGSDNPWSFGITDAKDPEGGDVWASIASRTA